MQHSFDVDIAVEYGILEAIILNNLWFWIKKNEANKVNYFDNDYWTYNSVRAFGELFPYVSQKQIQTALKHLENEGLIKTGNYNKSTYDRTLWYAFDTQGKSIMQKSKMEVPKKENGLVENVEPIPDINTNINTNNKENIKRKIFKKPTLEEVKQYCIERKNNVDAQKFIDYYEANNWTDSKGNKVKSWKQKVITWETHQPKQQIKEDIIPEWFNKDFSNQKLMTDKDYKNEMEQLINEMSDSE
jgi:hypothetical protein